MNSNGKANPGITRAMAKAFVRGFAALMLLLAAQLGSAQTAAPAKDASGANAPVTAKKKAAPAPRIVFDHLKAGFELLGYHKLVKCEECHIKGVFRGTPRDCATCHAVGSRFVTATTMTAKHFQVGAKACDDCHVTSDWNSVNVRHDSAMTGKCLSCHDGTHASGEPPNHFPTQQASCDFCHSTLTWLKAFFDHAKVVAGTACSSCHNGSMAQGPGTNHIKPLGGAPLADCVQCHGPAPVGLITLGNYSGLWAETGTFRHADWVLPSCSSCHNNVLEVGVGPNKYSSQSHFATAADCALCHKTLLDTRNGGLGFAAAAMDHTGITSGCTACHNGQTFQGLPTLVDHGPAAAGTLVTKVTGHFATTLPCETCHKFNRPRRLRRHGHEPPGHHHRLQDLPRRRHGHRHGHPVQHHHAARTGQGQPHRHQPGRRRLRNLPHQRRQPGRIPHLDDVAPGHRRQRKLRRLPRIDGERRRPEQRHPRTSDRRPTRRPPLGQNRHGLRPSGHRRMFRLPQLVHDFHRRHLRQRHADRTLRHHPGMRAVPCGRLRNRAVADEPRWGEHELRHLWLPQLELHHDIQQRPAGDDYARRHGHRRCRAHGHRRRLQHLSPDGSDGDGHGGRPHLCSGDGLQARHLHRQHARLLQYGHLFRLSRRYDVLYRRQQRCDHCRRRWRDNRAADHDRRLRHRQRRRPRRTGRMQQLPPGHHNRPARPAPASAPSACRAATLPRRRRARFATPPATAWARR